jgi:ubiquitin C-terminal hydrolase
MKPRGLVNVGNTCYFNSGLQLAFRMLPVSRFFLESEFDEKSICTVYKNFMGKYANITSKIAPKTLKRSLAKFHRKYRYNGQEDCQEFLAELFDVMEENMSVEQKKTLSSMIDSVQTSVLTCPNCNYRSESTQPLRFLSLPLAVPSNDDDECDFENDITLEYLFKRFCEMEELDVGEEWLCEGECKQRVKATKKLSISSWSSNVIVHLRRFNGLRKVNVPVKMPTKWQNRCLKACVCHIGGVMGGHYYCLLKCKGKWYNANDATVSEVPKERLDDELSHGYMYLYCEGD